MIHTGLIGRPIDRVDGPYKVTGRARYAAEFFPPDVAYGVLVLSTVPSGQVRIDTGTVRSMPGVLGVLTHDNVASLPQKGRSAYGPPAGRTMSLLQDDEVHYNGEPVAVVVAETFEQATEAAAKLDVTYVTRAAQLSFDAAKSVAHKPEKLARGTEPDLNWGDVDAGLRAADVVIENVYTTPMEHHNPIEPHGTVAHWENDRLTLYDATQYVSGVRQTVSKTLGIEVEKVRVIDPYVGGGFGCKGSTWSHVVLAALAAKQVQRPVKLVLSRPQMFGPVGGRPQTEQRLVLGAARDGKLTGLRHAVISHTSVMEDFAEACTNPTRSLYACANGAVTQRLAKLNVGVPTFQRAPGESTGSFAIESALDELAYALGMDPLDLRLRNYAEAEPSTGKPWSSKQLRACYSLAAERFGWARRTREPRSMRDGRWLVGWGMATATYPGHRMTASAVARMLPGGNVLVQSGTQDLGTGTYTIMTQIAAQSLGVAVERVRFVLGDTALPQAPVSGGSMTAASVGPAVQNACVALRDKLIALSVADPASPLHGRAAVDATIENGWIVAREGSARESVSDLVGRQRSGVEARGDAKPGEEEKQFASRSFGAVFAEVRVDEQTAMLQVQRISAVYSVGKVMNEKTARSQLEGGIVWGLGMALFEHSVLDPRYGRFVNANLAEYHVPVNADVRKIEVDFVTEDDQVFNPLGGRGIGEIGITGVPGAVANAVFHATGKRIRDLPITLDKLI
ncbi:MAG TPA: xanthine dehydrogenase family protein molybdopterin-binding subunit [Burkholderiales bacterium]|nr:xanthine dehydrogenase family protein molybdopterin-binding subunit [Burkholderiales bacterium]